MSDLDALAELEFDVAVPCMASPRNPCPTPAMWNVECRHCRRPQPRCHVHFINLQLIALLVNEHVRCGYCGRSAPTFEELVNIVPLVVNP